MIVPSRGWIHIFSGRQIGRKRAAKMCQNLYFFSPRSFLCITAYCLAVIDKLVVDQTQSQVVLKEKRVTMDRMDRMEERL